MRTGVYGPLAPPSSPPPCLCHDQERCLRPQERHGNGLCKRRRRLKRKEHGAHPFCIRTDDAFCQRCIFRDDGQIRPGQPDKRDKVLDRIDKERFRKRHKEFRDKNSLIRECFRNHEQGHFLRNGFKRFGRNRHKGLFRNRHKEFIGERHKERLRDCQQKHIRDRHQKHIRFAELPQTVQQREPVLRLHKEHLGHRLKKQLRVLQQLRKFRQFNKQQLQLREFLQQEFFLQHRQQFLITEQLRGWFLIRFRLFRQFPQRGLLRRQHKTQVI